MNRGTLGWLAASAAFATMVAVAVAVATVRQTRAGLAADADLPAEPLHTGVRVDTEQPEAAHLVAGSPR
ncbi:hypothetical protein JQS43_19270 [Natronosporangium hydrolyticum]|uniref:Uncharacterized protein n=1 Tax=Natronosporangium hydrolyticum TaxID=2811111 RepID=A0A895YGN7_9ACTN|nr:hypothetical protein [Natronosporangium hydrolyticum]QSB13696.1 hypothetical protein JQS43_19270 [Natronosporangium hydrolyticum]